MAKILVVEDDVLAAKSLKDWLEQEKHTVELCHDGETGSYMLQNYKYDIAVLDWELPGMSGIELLKGLNHSARKCHLLMLTGKSKIDDKEMGFNCGADDYLTKPFELRELSVRIRALLRRGSEQHSAACVCRDLELNPATGRVMRNGEEIKLLPTEYALLEFFMRRQGQLFHVDDILEQVWRSDSEATATAVRTYMTRLRKKIDVPNMAPYIATVYGLGYRMDGQ